MAAKRFKMNLKGGWDPEPWIILPAQMGPRAALTPEQKLCWALLDSVVHDLACSTVPYVKGSRTRYRRTSPREDALAYVYRVDHYWGYSFDRVCEQIDIDPHAFRRALEKAHAA